MKKASIAINNYDNHLVISVNDQSNLIDHVPAMVYKVALSREGILMIKDRPKFTLPQLRFGKHNTYFRRISASYDRYGKSNGVLLQGAKGSGKSLMAEELGNWMISQDLPVIMITAPLGAEELAIIIKAVGPCMVYFDEFGKVYHDPVERERLLPLFSDTSYEGVMFVITGNEPEEFSTYLVNRPQRFRYCISYSNSFDKETLDDILTTMQVTPELHPAFYAYCIGRTVADLNFDALMCVIRESAGCKDANEVADLCDILNVPDFPRMQWYVSAVEASEPSPEAAHTGYSINTYPSLAGITVVVNESSGTLTFGYGRDNDDTLSKNQSIVLDDLDPEEGTRKVFCQGHRTFEITLTYGFIKHCPDAILSPKPPKDTASDPAHPGVTGTGSLGRLVHGANRSHPRPFNNIY